MTKGVKTGQFIGILDLNNLETEVIEHIIEQIRVVQADAKLGHDKRVSVTACALSLAILAGAGRGVRIGDLFELL